MHPFSALAAVFGIMSHWGYFIHGEYHMWAPVYGFLLVAVIPPLYLLEFKIHKDDASQAAYSVLEVLAAYLLPLFTSIIAYRLFFHRLRHFPGPIGARISKLWHTWQVREAKNHLVLDKLYHEYGTFVRTGNLDALRFQYQPC